MVLFWMIQKAEETLNVCDAQFQWLFMLTVKEAWQIMGGEYER